MNTTPSQGQKPVKAITHALLPGAKSYQKKRAAMTPEEQKKFDKAVGVVSLLGVGAFFPGILGGVLIMALLAMIALMYALFAVASALAPLFWLAGVLLPTIFAGLLWQTEFRPLTLDAIDRVFSRMLGTTATDDKVFTRFILIAALIAVQIPYGILFAMTFPR